MYVVIAWAKGKRSTTEREFGPFLTKRAAHVEQRARKAPGIETRVAFKSGNTRRVY